MIVLDCSAAVEMARSTETGQALRSLVSPAETICAPMLLHAEFAHAIGKYVKAGLMETKHAARCLKSVLSLVDSFADDGQLAVEALLESLHYGCSSYDMFYFVLARRTGATLFTLDKRLANLCLDNKVDVVVLADI